MWLYPSVPPVINVSHSEEDAEVNVEETEEHRSREEEPTTSDEHIKVRNNN